MVDSDEVDAFEFSELSDVLLGWPVVRMSLLLFIQSVTVPCAAMRFETVKTVDESICFSLPPVDEPVGLLASSFESAELVNANCLPAAALSRLTFRLIGAEADSLGRPPVVNCVSIVAVRGTRGRLADDCCSSFDDDLLAIVWLDV